MKFWLCAILTTWATFFLQPIDASTLQLNMPFSASTHQLFNSSTLEVPAYKTLSRVANETVADSLFPNRSISHKSDNSRLLYATEFKLTDEFDESKRNSLGLYVFGGMGLGFSMEYERKLMNTYKGLGIRAGLGIAAFDISYFSIPFQLNYLIGGDGEYLELGAGATGLINFGNTNEPICSVLGLELPGHNRFWMLSSATVVGRFALKWNTNQMYVLRIGITPIYGYGQFTLVPLLNLEFPF
jgi:hypothetical protein